MPLPALLTLGLLLQIVFLSLCIGILVAESRRAVAFILDDGAPIELLEFERS